jgi:hypothetical protein
MKPGTLKIKSLRFQRNGVAGQPFYHAFVDNLPDFKGNFLITFQSNYKDLKVLPKTCRVVCLDKPNLAWRGDNIAAELNERISIGLESERQRRNNPKLTIYDLITL